MWLIAGWYGFAAVAIVMLVGFSIVDRSPARSLAPTQSAEAAQAEPLTAAAA